MELVLQTEMNRTPGFQLSKTTSGPLFIKKPLPSSERFRLERRGAAADLSLFFLFRRLCESLGGFWVTSFAGDVGRRGGRKCSSDLSFGARHLGGRVGITSGLYTFILD